MQTVMCFECEQEWPRLPVGFIYDDPAAGWRQDPHGQLVEGYCRPCADGINAATPRYGSRQHEAYLIECERYEN